MNHQIEFRVLGPLEVISDGRSIPIDAPKQRALLAVLLLHANEVVSTDRLMDAVWSGEESGVGVSTLRYHISKLRAALEGGESSRTDGVIATRPPGYVLEVEADCNDAIRFERLIDEARRLQASDPEAALIMLDEALGLWRGDPYAEFVCEEFAHLEVERLEEKRRGAIEDRFDALLAIGRHREAIAELQALVPAHPLRERLWGQQALSLYRSGRQAEAVDVLQRLRSQLGNVGLELSPPLQELEKRVFAQDPSLLTDVSAPDQLRGYVLRGCIGEGAHGVVWRAAQPGIGREVALKAIRPELANQPEFVRRFEAEAQLVAALEHPNIVSLYDFWRDPEGAYLVMPYLRGGNLAAVLKQGPLDPPAVLELVTAIGAALGHAHRRGVVHRDVTPHNVLLDEDGNPYLADFGMAALLGGEGPPVTSSPAYMSPEASTGQKAVVQSDVFSLGVLVHASLTGRVPVVGEELPLVSELRHDLSRAVDDVISCATSADYVHRYGDVQDFVDALAHAVGVSREDTPSLEVEDRNPYKGLRAFEESDAADFFGREMLVSELVQSVARHRLVGVVGPSGCGKSSLVKAGMIPVLRSGALPGSERWLITDMYPGSRPFAELGAALMRVAVERPDGFEATLADPEADLAPAFDQLLPRDGELLLVVDQFEELFTLTISDGVRGQFLDLLTRIGGDPVLRARVVLTMRADFYDRPLEYPEFGELVRRGLVSVTMPAKEHLHDAITGPAARVGIGVDEGLAETIVNDVAGEPGALPLMEYALTELFERRTDQRLSLDAYKQRAGVMGALGRRAEEIFKRYDESGKDAVRQVFLRLVTVEAGSEDTRRRIPLTELQGLGIDPAALQQTLDDFGEHRLLTFDRDPDTREPTVEVAHEALLSRWERLRMWIDDRRDDLGLQRRLATAAGEWNDADRATEYLLGGGRLDHYQAFMAETDLPLSKTETDFLAQSRQHSNELAVRRRRRRQAIMAGFGVAAVIATVFAVVALLSQRKAEEASDEARANEELALLRKDEADTFAADAKRQTEIAQDEALRARASELAAFAVQVLDEDPDLSLRLLLESIDTAEPSFETIASLHETVLAHRLVAHLPEPYWDGALSPDGTTLISFADDTFAAIERSTGEVVWEKPQDRSAWIAGGVFTTDGDAVVGIPEPLWDSVPEAARGVHRIDVATGERTVYPIGSTYPIDSLIPNGSGQIDSDLPLTARFIDEDARTAGVLRLDLEAGTADMVATYSFGAISRGRWSTDGDVTKVALGLSQRTAVLDLQTGATESFGPTSDYFADQALSPDGSLVATTSTVRNDVWNIVTGESYWPIPGSAGADALFTKNGEEVLVGNRLFSDSGELLVDFRAEGGDPSISADGQVVAMGGGVFNAGPNGEVGAINLPVGGRYSRGLSIAGDIGVSVQLFDSAFGPAHLFDVTSGEVVLQIDHVMSIPSLSADGGLVALQQEIAPNWFGSIGLFDTSSGDLTETLPGLCATDNNTGPGPDCREFPGTPFSGFAHRLLLGPDGQFLAASLELPSENYAFGVWDLASGDLLYLSREVTWFGEPIPSPSGDRLFVPLFEDEELRVVILDTSTWDEMGEITGETHGEGGVPFALRFDPDGSLLTVGDGGFVRLDGESLEPLQQFDSHCDVSDLQMSSDGSTVAASCWYQGDVFVYDGQTGAGTQEIRVGDDDIRAIAFLGETELLVVPHSGPGLVLTTDIEELIEIARTRVVDEFDEEECDMYNIDPCPAEPEPEEEPEG